MNRFDWHDRLVAAEKALGLRDGFRFVYGPWDSLATGRVAFLSLNPGRAPSDTLMREVSDERGNSYAVERLTTVSPITDQALRCFAFLGVDPDEVLTGVVCPFRTPSWTDLSGAQKHDALKFGRRFWEQPLSRPGLELIVTCSNEATTAVTDWLDARLEESLPAGWGDIRIHRFRSRSGVPIVALPHLSRFRLFGRPESERAIRRLLEGGSTTGLTPVHHVDPPQTSRTEALEPAKSPERAAPVQQYDEEKGSQTMLLNAAALDAQLADHIDDGVRKAYLTLAHANLPDGMTVRPASHGFISRELRFEANGRWLYSAVLNRKWVLWYFRKPALNAGLVEMVPTRARFPESELTGGGEIKFKFRTAEEANAVLDWIRKDLSS
jgi:hypothetical protein